MQRTLLIIAPVLLIACALYAQTEVSGIVGGVWSAENSPYHIIDDVIVPPDSTLIINPGVVVMGNPQRRIYVSGRIVAIGSEQDSIMFTNAVEDSMWDGIDIFHAAQPASIFKYCTIEYAGTYNGNVHGGALCIVDSEVEVLNSVFRHNYSVFNSPAIYSNDSHTYVHYCTFIYNDCEGGGTVGADVNGYLEITHSLFAYNTADIATALLLYPNEYVLDHLTIANNQARIPNWCTTFYSIEYYDITNSIIWNEQDGTLYDGRTPSIYYCDAIADVFGGENNIFENPRFVDPENLDFRLTERSPCIDAGAPTFPPDPDGTRNDMGAYYFNAEIDTLILAPLTMNLISSNRYFDNYEAPDVLGTIENLLVAFSHTGGIYIPGINLNTIGTVDISSGYLVLCNQESIWSPAGEYMDSETEYSIEAGNWNFIGYPFAHSLPVETALSEIEDELIIVMNDRGGIWIPELNVNTMGFMSGLKGYMAMVNTDVTFTYTNNGLITNDGLWETPEVENPPQSTGVPYPVLVSFDETIKDYNPSIIEIYDSELLVGKAIVLDNHEITPVTTWKGLPDYNVPGFTDGHTMTIKVLNTNGELIAEQNSCTFNASPYGQVHFTLNNVINSQNDIPQEFELLAAYPNPFNSCVNIPFKLSSTGMVKMKVYNILGETVYKESNIYQPGNNVINFETSRSDLNLSNGVYILELNFNNQVLNQKIMLLK